jgi:hypothetical protein
MPNDDGQILATEIPLKAGLSAKFLAAENVAVSTAGVMQPDGSRLWDYTTALAGDHLTLVETQPLAGKWFEGLFAGASYAARLSEGEDLLGVFEVTPTALLLRGVVSPQAGPTRTELKYAPAVHVLDFPLAEGSAWKTSATVTGLALGVAALYSEAYENEVDAHGVVKTPFADFPVLRVHVALTRTVGTVPLTIHSHLFVAECFGTVATVVSHEYELEPEFTSAAEVRRLSP